VETEEQQVEEIKRWWSEHGRAVVTGLVLGLGGVSGWAWWQKHEAAQAEQASGSYTEVVNATAARRDEQAQALANQLIAEFPDSGYAGLAALVAARSAASSSDAETAKRQLRWVAAHAARPEMQSVARVRLARLLTDEGDHASALTELGQVTTPGFASVVSELRGDVLQVQGDPDGARAAYDTVLETADLAAATRDRVRMKLDDLGHLSVN
jgi:predicted negative regulator of RcsB-dependent stress response